jgi:predicted DsbA family dithiol-disulfide isomerase
MRALATERGDVEIAIRHAPLAMHPHAVEGAKAAIAAERQGKLEPFMRAAFANEGPLDEAAIARCARAAGLDSAAFAADRSSAATEARLAEDRALATKLGVEGTPTSFVDGRRVRGAQTRTTFEHALDARS